MAKIDITARLNAASVDGILASANQIYDENKGKFQTAVNEDLDKRLKEQDGRLERYHDDLVDEVNREVAETIETSQETIDQLKEASEWLKNDVSGAQAIMEQTNKNTADITAIGRNTGLDEYSEFSTGMDYAAGDVVLYDGVLFRFKADHAKGAWDYNEVEDWSEKKEREEKLSELGSEVNTKLLGLYIGYNLIENCKKGLFIREDGVTVGTNSDYGYISKVYCKGIRHIAFTTAIRRILFYDKEYNVMSNITDTSICEVPEGTYYISINVTLAYEDTRVKSILCDNYNSVNFDYLKDSSDITPEVYAKNAYVNKSYSLTTEVEGCVVYKFDVEPLGIYNIVMYSLGPQAVDFVFYDEEGNKIIHIGTGTSEVKSKIVVAPKNASYALVSTLNDLPISIKKLKRTDNLSEYLDEMSNIENEHYKEVSNRISNVDSHGSYYVSFGVERLTESGFIRVEDGVKGTNEEFVCTPFLPIVPGSDIMTTYTPGSTSGYAFYSASNEESFISGTQETKNIKVPNNALYFRVSSKNGNSFDIGYMSASLGALCNHTKNAIIKYDIKLKDLQQGFIEVAEKDTKFKCNYDAYDFKSTLLRCFEGQQFELNTIGGINTAKAYQFFNAECEPVGTNKVGAFTGIITAPENAYYLCVNVKLSSMPTAEDDFYLRSVIPSAKEIEDINKKISAIENEVEDINLNIGQKEREYTLNDLIPGNLNTYPVGNSANVGTLPEWVYGLFPCAPGTSCTITTLGGSDTARGIGFIDKNNIIIFSSKAGKLDNETFIAPEGTAFVGVNLKITESSDFHLSVSTLRSQVDKNTEDIARIKAGIISAKESIPLWYGKDMFFIKDKPLDFYAKEVLLKNYPSYKGVYVNNAPILATGKNYDFNLPIINHINPEGKVYFEDGSIVDIYADNGNLYKDQWNVVRNIQVHTTDIATKQKSIKVMFIGSSTTEIGMATYVKKYLETFGVTMIGCGSRKDYLGTKSEGYYGWSNEQLCGKVQNAKTYPQTGTSASNPFMKLATEEDKINYPKYCFTYIEGSTGTRQSYEDAEDKSQNFYIFDFSWYLQTRQVETPDVVFYLLGTNGGIDNYGKYMPWIVDRIIQACPNTFIGINLGQAYRLESGVDSKLTEMEEKLSHLYNYVETKGYDKMKVVSLHAHQSPDFSHNFDYENGENTNTSKANPIDGFLHMDNNGYLQDAKCIGAYIAYCLPNLQ